MSLGEYIKWCKCKRYILTTGQKNEEKPCDLCQKEHAEDFRQMMEEAQQEEEICD